MRILSRAMSRLGLRSLLLIAAAIGLAPLSALDIARLNRAKDAAVLQAEQNMSAIAEQTASHQQELVTQALGLLQVLTRIPAVRTASPECEPILSNLRASQSAITSITVVDAAGRGLCGSTSPTRLDVGARRYFTEMKRTRSLTVSEAMIGQASKRELIAAALPILDDSGEVDGAIVLGIDLASIKQLLTQTSTLYDASVVLIDRSGRPVASTRQLSVPAEQAGPFHASLAAAPSGAFQSDLAHGTGMIFGVQHLPELGMTVAVGVSRAAVFAPIERAFWTDLALLIATALGSFGVTVLFVELGVSRGLRHIHHAAQAMVSGRPKQVLAVPPSVVEVEHLARSFNTMVTELEGFAYHDRLTGLGNRRLLERYLADATRTRTLGPFAVLAVDLDEFKPVNDKFGHRVGDLVLAEVAERLADNAPGAEMVARLGGDEFIVVLREDRNEIARIAMRLRDAVAVSYAVGDKEVTIGCCVGVAFVERDEPVPGPVEMLDRADEALYQAKRNGRSRVVVHGPEVPEPRLVGGTGILAAPRPWQAAG